VLSGGERKRTSIGVELISDPSLIMLDEPTSGLDSFKALGIVKLLHSLARDRGKTIVSTIHSPSSESFFFFDRLILMCDGYIVYQGQAKQSVPYFRGMNYDVPRFGNPADFFMKELSIKYPKSADDEKKLEKLIGVYRMQIQRNVTTECNLIRLPAPDMQSAAVINYKAATSEQIRQLFMRSWILAKREPRLFRARLMQTVCIALFMLCVFWGLDDYAAEGDISSMVGAIYFICVCQMFLNFLPTVIVSQRGRPVYMRERASDLYDIWVYATTKLLAELPAMLLIPFLLNLMLYFAIGFQNSITEFFAMYLIYALMVQAAMALGYFLSSMFNGETTAVAFSPIINLPLNLLGGYMINLQGIFQRSP